MLLIRLILTFRKLKPAIQTKFIFQESGTSAKLIYYLANLLRGLSLNKQIGLLFLIAIMAFSILGCMDQQTTTINSNPKPVPTYIETSTNSMTSTEQQITQLPTSVLTAASGPSLPISVQLSLSETPILNKPVELTAVYSIQRSNFRELPGQSFEIRLPSQFECIDGALKQIADLHKDEAFQQRVKVRSIDVGRNIEIEAYSYSPLYQGQGGSAYLYFIITENGVIVRDKVFTPDIGSGTDSLPPPTFGPDITLPSPTSKPDIR
jgi:hypothetical protein